MEDRKVSIHDIMYNLPVKIRQVDPQQSGCVTKFIDLPFRLYQTSAQWVPPLELDARRPFDLKHNPFYTHSEAVFLLAEDSEGTALGRLAVLNPRRYNDFNQEQTAFFCLFECIDDPEVARALFTSGCDWARVRGLTRMYGPKGFSALDGLGLLDGGFEHRPALGVAYNPPYYRALMMAAGLQPANAMVSGYMDRTTPFPDKIHHVSKMVQERRGLRVINFRTRGELRMLVPRLKDLYNGALYGTSGNVPLTDDEARSMAEQILWFADPSLIKVILKGEELVGFLFAYPDISAALQRTGGRLWPLGWVDILVELRRTPWINVNGAGIIEEFRGMGGTAILFSEMWKSFQNSRYQFADLVQIGVDNDKMQRELANLGIVFYKTHRMFEMNL